MNPAPPALSIYASELLEALGKYPLDGCITIYPEARELSQRTMARIAMELVATGLATLGDPSPSGSSKVHLTAPPDLSFQGQAPA